MFILKFAIANRKNHHTIVHNYVVVFLHYFHSVVVILWNVYVLLLINWTELIIKVSTNHDTHTHTFDEFDDEFYITK